MTRRQPTDFTALRAFVDVVEHGSLSAAGRATGVAKATLSRQLAELERSLGTVLVRRNTRAQSISAAGQALYDRVAPLLAETDAAVHDASRGAKETTGLVRIGAALGFGHAVLLPIVAKFMAANRGVRCEMSLSDDRVHVVESGFDIAIRMGMKVEDSEMLARRIAKVERLIVASPQYLKANGTPRSIAELHHHSALVVDDQHAVWPFASARGTNEVRVAWSLGAGSMPTLVEATLRGLGIALLPRYLIESHLKRGELVKLSLGAEVPVAYATALVPGGKTAPASVRQFLTFVSAALAKDPILSVR